MKTFEEFKETVKGLTTKSDYNSNRAKLETVMTFNWQVLVQILMFGSTLKNAFKVLDMLTTISIRTNLDSEQALNICIEARIINKLIDSK